MDKKQRICRICNRRFANGKAMGGHMRSHLAKLPVPAKPDTPVVVESAAPTFASPSSSLSLHSNKDLVQTATSTHNNRSIAVSESETESPRTTKRRSQRRRRAAMLMDVLVTPPTASPTMVVPEPVSVSSVTLNFSIEEVALCLLKLSKDKWSSKGKQVVEYVEEEDEDDEEEYEEEEEEEEEDEEDEEDGLFSVTGGGASGVGRDFKTKRKVFKCEKCNKCFPSYQSLGGHKASHKKIKYVNFNSGFGGESCSTTAVGAIGGGGSSSQQKIRKNIFECAFCDKVFESGQALGGHKKVHFSHLSVSPKPLAKSSENFIIDLNQPAPEVDGDV